MTIYQTNLYICDVCGAVISLTAEEGVYSDPVIGLPDDWFYVDHPDGHSKLNCPKHAPPPLGIQVQEQVRPQDRIPS